MKVLTIVELDYIIIYDNIEIVDKFIFLGVLITNDGVTDKELRSILVMGKCDMISLKGIFKDRGISLTTKIMIVQTFQIILYGAKTWTIKKVDREKMDAFELCFWIKLLGVIYLDRKRNTDIIIIIKPKRSPESRIVKSALSFSDTLLEQM